MSLLRRLTFALLTVAVVAPVAVAQSRRPITFEDFALAKIVSDPQLSPDGKWLLYAVRSTDLAANRRTTRTFKTAVAGGKAEQFPDAQTNTSEARWSPDGKSIAYISGGQLWVISEGSGRKQLTSLAGGASGPVWSPIGDRIAFVSAVYPECRDDACNAAKDKSKSESKVKAHAADNLLFRHWNAYDEGTRSHLFVVKPNGSDLRDLIPGATYDVPPGPFGGSEGYTFSADGRQLAFTAKDQGAKDAWSTDINLYGISAEGGEARLATVKNKGADQNPVASPDGKTGYYASQARAGFEADRWRLMAMDVATGTTREVLPTWDRNADGIVVAPDSKSLLVLSGDVGRDKYFRVTLDATGKASAPQPVITEHNNTQLSIAQNGTVAWIRESGAAPAEVWVGTLDASGVSHQRQFTHENDALLAQLTLPPLEDFWFTGSNNVKMHGFVMKPPQFAAGKKFPVLLLVHGGPQGAWLDAWSTRWNYQMFATGGYGLVILNPTGSTGYGQKLTDGVSKDWGGKTYVDLMKGLDAALKANPWMDSTRMAAAGGSYGGYMVNWIAGHTHRFKALVSHAGPFNLENMYAATEELWFPEWEYGGPFWNPTAMATQYRKFSPHLFAQNFKTPTLVIHGELDYRVPYTEGLSMFTSLRRQGVDARIVVYPDEGHWILKPQNSQLWYKEVHGWLGKYLDARPKM
ncbi:MAG TPA: S9 family peptidase [Gemmatimonadaceae bacterium]|jgi:dipeptidyl aminopeptidase/acylaminoacyl peptidase